MATRKTAAQIWDETRRQNEETARIHGDVTALHEGTKRRYQLVVLLIFGAIIVDYLRKK